MMFTAPESNIGQEMMQEAHRCSKACLVELQKHLLLPFSVNEEVSLLPKNAHHDRRKSTLELRCKLP